MSKAALVYSGSLEGFSVMLLTVMMLWTALDKAVITHYLLLKKFDSGFPATILTSLLWPKRNWMDQLRRVGKHLLTRNENSLAENSSIFSDISSPLSFGAQYFDQSSAHQTLKRRIEQEATEASLAKKQELKAVKRESRELMKQSNENGCTIITKLMGRGGSRRLQTVHDPCCEVKNLDSVI